MVKSTPTSTPAETGFQYSLCRVVLMVDQGRVVLYGPRRLSVLALSSRFDGHRVGSLFHFVFCLSVLALSSRFDGPLSRQGLGVVVGGFQYSLCRVVLMVPVKPRGNC